MKTFHSFLVLGCLLWTGRTHAADAVADWVTELASVQQATQQNAGGRERAAGILQEVLAGASAGLAADRAPGATAKYPPDGANLAAATAEAGFTAMAVLYPQVLPTLEARREQMLARIQDGEAAVAAGRAWGEEVARAVLEEQGDAVMLNRYSFNATAPTSSAPEPWAEATEAEADTIATGRYRFRLLAGSGTDRGHADGVGATARFGTPTGVAVDAAGNVYVSEPDMRIVRKITPEGVVTTLAGTAGQRGTQDGVGAAARFEWPTGLAVDRIGNVYVADGGSNTIRRIEPSGLVTTIAGTAGFFGEVDGSRADARLKSPSYLTVDAAGNVFVSEERKIRKIAPDGTVSSLAVKLPAGYSSMASTWPQPLQLVVDSAENLYVIYSDWWNYSRVMKCIPSASGEYVAEELPVPFSALDIYLADWATALGMDAAGNLHVKYGSSPLWVLAPTGKTEIRFAERTQDEYWWQDLAVSPSGELKVLLWGRSDTPEPGVRTAFYDPGPFGPVIDPIGHPRSQSTAVGGGAHFSVRAFGAGPLSYQWFFNSNPISGATQSSLAVSGTRLADGGDYHVVVSDPNGSTSSNAARLTVQPAAGSSQTPSPTLPATGASGGGGAPSPGFLLMLALLVLARNNAWGPRLARAQADGPGP